MRVLLIVNAVASSVTARRRVVIQKALGADHDLEVAETVRAGHAARLARAAALEGVDVVVVLAGDGTLNEAADGLAGTSTALAPLPGGSTNVFARSIGVSRDPIEATAQLLASLDAGSFDRIGLGVANDRHFLVHCGVGFDAAVIEQAERRSVMKRYAAPLLFVASAFDTWLRAYDHSRPRLDVELPDGEVIEGSILTIVSNTTPYTYFGSTPVIVEDAVDLHGPLAVTVVTTRRMVGIVRIGISAVASHRVIRRHPGVVHRRGVTAMKIRGHGPFPYQVDGEHLGVVEELAIAHEPDALTLVVPAAPDARHRERS
ncbi:MAG: diacylglycerol kinase family lipid kinase [Actinobacteria bacterium]|nr:diacylglycerol kinase family lipid kinase [Actinomycetota bacterium]